jgi:MraZ protein
MCKARWWWPRTPTGCLSLYPLPVWEQFENHLLSLPAVTTPGAASSWAAPPKSKSTAVRACSSRPSCALGGLEKDVKFMGVGAHFELWDMARYEARELAAIAQGRPEPLRNLVIR